MEPVQDVRTTRATLVDLLDRVLDKGLVIQADIIVSVAGIPLIGVQLRAALAGMETMTKYGLLKDWDESIRARAKIEKKELPLLEGEQILLKMLGSYYWSKDIYTAWRPGYCYLTSKRLVLYHQDFGEVIFQTTLEEIKGITMREEEFLSKEKREVICLLLNKGQTAKLHVLNNLELKDALEKRMQELQLDFESNAAIPEDKPKILEFLAPGEKITHQDKMWHQIKEQSFGQIRKEWRPGYLYLTVSNSNIIQGRLIWWNDFNKKIVIQIPVKRMIHAFGEDQQDNLFLTKRHQKTLNVLYVAEEEKKIASFSGNRKEIDQWEKVLNEIIEGKKTPRSGSEPEAMETCPSCGNAHPTKKLLIKGCPSCGWVSPTKKKEKLKQYLWQ